MTAAIAIAAFSAIGLVAIAAFIKSPALVRFDTIILEGIRHGIGPRDTRASHKLQVVKRDITALGGDTLAVLLLLVGGATLLAQGRGGAAMQFAIIILAGRLVGWLIKRMARRERPPAIELHIRTFTSSFPSIHTLMVFVNAFALARLLVPAQECGAALAAAGVVSALVGWTRLYFAVHWPSDVLAGWFGGCLVCTACILAFNL